jgi:hypothetical protein
MRKRRRDPNVLRWLQDNATESMFISAITIGEIERGIESERRRNRAFAETLDAWLHQMIRLYQDRILAIDVAVARRWGRLIAQLGHNAADLLIAATALEHGLTVVTRNVRHFLPTGAAVENPFEH